MTDTTKKIEEVLGLQKFPEIADITNKYLMWDDGGTEIEVGEFLGSLVRMLKPENYLETGLYSGISCMYVAQAMEDNGFGSIDSVEYEKYHADRSEERLKKMGLLHRVKINLISSLDFVTNKKYGIILLDSEPQIRFKELLKFYDNLLPGGLIIIHDLHDSLSQGNINPEHPDFFSWPYGNLPQEIKDLIKTDKLRCVSFNTPRGITIFFKPTDTTYRWN